MAPFTRVLVANRGEIARRIVRACHEEGLESVAVYSDADRLSPHVRAAHRAVPIGAAPATESYLDIAKLLEAARATDCQAVHPGYGFLSERAPFAEAVTQAGRTCLRPPATATRARGGGAVGRKIPRPPPPHRSPGARRHLRPGGRAGRARVQHSTPPPEADRGGSVRRGDSRAAAAPERGGDRRRRLRGLPRRRHDRVSARSDRRVLLPRDEHATPGRAPRYRAGVRGGHRARAAARRAGPPSAGARRCAATARPRHRVPHHRGRSVQRLPAGHRRHPPPAAALRPGRPLGWRRGGGQRGDAVLRLAPRQAHRVGRHPGHRAAAHAPGAARARDRGPPVVAVLPSARDGRPRVPAWRRRRDLFRTGGPAAPGRRIGPRAGAAARDRRGAARGTTAHRGGAAGVSRRSARWSVALAPRRPPGKHRRVSEGVTDTPLATRGGGGGGLADGRAGVGPRPAPGERRPPRDGVQLHKHFARGELAEIVGSGADRVAASCPHYVSDRCGGCQLQHLTYDAQLAAKRAIVGDALRRIGKLDVPDPEIVEAVEEWRYRAKISLAVEGGQGRARAVGLHPYDQPGRVFPLVDCHITDFRLMALWRELKPRLDLLPSRLTRLTLHLDRDGRRHILAESGGEPWLDAEPLRAALQIGRASCRERV